MGRAKTTSVPLDSWAARYYTWLLIKMMLKGVVFSFLFLPDGLCISTKLWMASGDFFPPCRTPFSHLLTAAVNMSCEWGMRWHGKGGGGGGVGKEG